MLTRSSWHPTDGGNNRGSVMRASYRAVWTSMALLWILTGVLAVAIVLDEAGH